MRAITKPKSNLQLQALIANALTGPLAREDLNTISKHLSVVHRDAILTLYKAMALATLP
ncbi:DUF2520 domain-containing protein [Legionella waltersii]|uniref:DUF2520 domain-containing protein n=1 Tax=Legionella waltersii TaxID=66969 RepID=UPI000A90EA23